MTEIINLNRARKAKARAEDEKRASENRIAFGRTKAEKAQAKAEKALSDRQQEGLRLVPPTPPHEKPE